VLHAAYTTSEENATALQGAQPNSAPDILDSMQESATTGGCHSEALASHGQADADHTSHISQQCVDACNDDQAQQSASLEPFAVAEAGPSVCDSAPGLKDSSQNIAMEGVASLFGTDSGVCQGGVADLFGGSNAGVEGWLQVPGSYGTGEDVSNSLSSQHAATDVALHSKGGDATEALQDGHAVGSMAVGASSDAVNCISALTSGFPPSETSNLFPGSSIDFSEECRPAGDTAPASLGGNVLASAGSRDTSNLFDDLNPGATIDTQALFGSAAQVASGIAFDSAGSAVESMAPANVVGRQETIMGGEPGVGAIGFPQQNVGNASAPVTSPVLITGASAPFFWWSRSNISCGSGYRGGLWCKR